MGLNKSILKQSLNSIFINIFIISCFFYFSLDPILSIGISFVVAEIITFALTLTEKEFRGLILKRDYF